jgi:GxxExxY protein
MDPKAQDTRCRRVIGLAVEVHRNLGPGLLETVYETCLCHEPTQAGIGFERQKKLPVVYQGHVLDREFKIDVVAEQALVVEVKAVRQIRTVHEARLMTYLRLTGHRLGLLLNFNEPALKDGIWRRRVRARRDGGGDRRTRCSTRTASSGSPISVQIRSAAGAWVRRGSGSSDCPGGHTQRRDAWLENRSFRPCRGIGVNRPVGPGAHAPDGSCKARWRR